MMRFSRILILPAVALFLVLSAGCTSKSDLSGKWKGIITVTDTGKTMSDLEFVLVQKSQDLTGMLIFTKVDGGKMKLSGSRTGDEVKFTTESKKGLNVAFTGTVKSGSRIEGTATLAYFDPKVPVKQDVVTLELTR